MQLCQDNITLIRPVRTQTTDTYLCYPIQDASFYQQSSSAQQGNGLTATGQIRIRIPETSMAEIDILPQIGDYIVKGTVEEMTGMRDIADFPHGKVRKVHDNRRQYCSHWAVICE